MARLTPWALLVLALALAAGCASKPSVRFQAVFVDLDGTALGADYNVRPATARALARYRACGGHVGVATGRSIEQVRSHLRDLDPDLALILDNGAVTYSADGRRVLSVRRLPGDVVREAVAVLKGADGVKAIVLHDLGKATADRTSPDFDAYIAQVGLAPWIDPALEVRGPDQPVRVVALVAPERLEFVAASLRRTLGERARVMVPSGRTVHVVPVGVDKADAILDVAAAAGIAPADVLAFGDGGNDVGMLSRVGAGFAMGNAQPETKAAALGVIGAHDTDALARVIEALAIAPGCSRRSDNK